MSRSGLYTFALVLVIAISGVSHAQEDSSQLSSVGELIDFVRDVKPILDAKCVVCHGPDDAKNDFRVDVQDSIADYVEAGDLESSSLWADYLVTDDEEMRMPPVGSDVHQLTGSELATIKLWIEEGAVWGEAAASTDAPEPEVAPKSDLEKYWLLQGLFHPASVHFPIALLSVSAAFVVLSFFKRETFEPAAFHCLWIGGLGAIAACILGWSYAQHEGYGAGFSFDLQNSSIDRHRWLGIAAAVLAIILFPIAWSVRRKGDTGMRVIWMIGSIVMMAAVSIAGFQGGELTYGEDHYLKEYNKMFPAEEVEAGDSEAEEEPGDSEAEEEEAV